MTEPCALVEAMGRPARSIELPDQREPGALWGCTAERELEQHRLARAKTAPPQNDGARAKLERAPAHRLLDLDDRALGCTDERRQRAVIDRRQAVTSESPAEGRYGEAGKHERDPARDRRNGESEQCRRRERAGCGLDPLGCRGGKAETERAAKCVRRPDGQGITSPFNWASLPGPMPGTPSSSATEWNGPCAVR